MLKRSSDNQLRPYRPPYGSTILENEDASAAEPPFDLRKIYSIIRRRLAVIAGLSILGSLLAVIYALQLTPLYTATATVLVDPRKTPRDERTPSASDCYRFCLSHPDVDMTLCGPASTEHVREACDALAKGPLEADELAWMRRVGDHVYGRSRVSALAD